MVGEGMIDADHLRRQFGKFVAIEDLSLSVAPGTLMALLGPNGAGKTTTVRMLAGLLRPSGGHAIVAGCDVRTDPAGVRVHVGLMTDSPGLHGQMNPRAYLDFFGRLYGVESRTRRQRIDDLLELFDLQQVATQRMATFSKGMQQKVALARALLHGPQVVFLDEPTSGLDPLAARTVRELIVGLKHDSRAIMLCTHDLDEAERLADSVTILRHGRIVASDSPSALRANASRERVIHVALAAECPAAVTVVSSIDGVVEPTVHYRQLSFRTADPERTNPIVIARLVATGARIVSVTQSTATLEDVYATALEVAAVP
jgi:ABC-2 type transport system ATP-binding protein